MTIGLASIGLKLPKHVIDGEKIAALNQIPPGKTSQGLGCSRVSLCWHPETVVSLAVGAAKRALERWGGSMQDIGLIAVGTESAFDEARPLSAWIAEELKLTGAIRSYEVKHACYAGTLALRQALEWKVATGSSKLALVIAADVCLYEPGHGAEVTQGAGAVALLVGEGNICSIDLRTYPYSEPCFDFWRPAGQPFPFVNGSKGVNSYLKAVEMCFSQLLQDQNLPSLDHFQFLCFHVPFPYMVIRAVRRLSTYLPIDRQESFLKEKIWPVLSWNQEIGNAYSASLWFSVAQALDQAQSGDTIACFSYGSGFGSELFVITCGSGQKGWAQDIEMDLANRQYVTVQEYDDWRWKNWRARRFPGSSPQLEGPL